MTVRFLNVNTASPEQLACWESWLTEEKRRRLACMPEKSRRLSLCGDGLAREMLGEVLHIAPERVVFTYTETGKPQTPGAFFSVSHSGDVVACAVSDREVGLDVEAIRPVPPRLADVAPGVEFWLFWTRREAAIKCRGGTLGQWKEETVEDGLIFTPIEAPEGYAAAVCEKE